MVLEPRLLLFDEPLSNLDFKLRVQMRFELRELQRRLGKTSIYVTHDQTEALALSDRIAVLSQGRIEQIGRPSEIYETPETAFVADFIGSSNILDATVESKSGVGASVRTGSGLELTVPPVVEEIGSRLLILVRPERIRLVDGREEAVSNRITAEIDDLTYLGEDVQLRVTTAPGAKLLVALKSGKGTRELRRGGSIDLAIDPEDIHLLRK
jgi:ABC-type Fe3+/spermidine/putrescine transport system ATPase subunit